MEYYRITNPNAHGSGITIPLQRRKPLRLTTLWKVILVYCLFCFMGCTHEHTDKQPEESFTLLVYLAADNDLSGEASEKREAIRQGYDPQKNSRVFIYQDSREESPCLLEVIKQHNEKKVEVLKTYPEHNSASADVFASVIRDMTTLAPTGDYGLLLFSHASGWLPAGALENPAGVTRSIGRDGTDEMELAEFAQAIPDGLFDYIVFEACFMAGIEVMDALQDKAQYILASSAEIVSPGFTNIYPAYFSLLQQGIAGLIPFAEGAFDHYNNQTGWKRSATFSVIRTASLPPLMDFIRREVPLNEEMNQHEIQPFDRYGQHLFFDLEELYSHFLYDPTHEELSKLLSSCVVWKAATPSFLEGYNGFAIHSHCGLTSYWPQKAFPGLNESWWGFMGSVF